MPTEPKKSFAEHYRENRRLQEQQWRDPQWTGKFGVIFAVISFFVIPYLGMLAAIMGIFGVYNTIKKKAGSRALLLNILAIILGLAAYILADIVKVPTIPEASTPE